MSWLKNIFHIWWSQWTWPLKLTSIGIVALVILLIVLGLRGCGKSTPKIDEASLQKINSANKKEREQELQKVIENNADVVKTVDNRSNIAETNVVERNRLIDEKVKAADQAIVAAKQQGRDVTSEELECILIPENCK